MVGDELYAGLTAMTSFEEVFVQGAGVPLPAGWAVFIADVRGSTRAIAEGRYRDVNFVGAACVVAVLNVCKPLSVPYVFGGDGATLAVPGSVADRVQQALLGVAAMARDVYAFELRVGRVEVARLLEAGHELRVACYQLAGLDRLAIFLGDGVEVAESLIKDPGAGCCVAIPEEVEAPDLTGLSCHWEPFVARPGVMLAILVRDSLDHEPAARRMQLYREVFESVREASGSLEERNPLKRVRLVKDRLVPSTHRTSARAHAWGRGAVKALGKRVAYLLEAVVSGLVFRLGLPVPGLDPQGYLDEQVERSDFQRFDGTLRLVVEVSHEQAERIEAYLAACHARGELCYGLHRSPAAIMTCAVFSVGPNSHVHFMDGSDGGFTAAAVGLKAQLRARQPGAVPSS